MSKLRLAYEAPCRSCSADIYVAVCADGFWRTFDKTTMPAGSEGSWSWRKRRGMEETDLVPGHPLHYCYGHRQLGPDHRDYVVIDDLPPAPLVDPDPEPAPVIAARIETHIPSPHEIDNARSPGGGWTLATLAAWGVPWPPPEGWRADLERRWRAAQGS